MHWTRPAQHDDNDYEEVTMDRRWKMVVRPRSYELKHLDVKLRTLFNRMEETQ